MILLAFAQVKALPLNQLACLVGEAVVALLDGGDVLGSPLVVPLPSVDAAPGGAPLGPADAREREARLAARRDLAAVPAARKRAELMIGQLERQAVGLSGQARAAATSPAPPSAVTT